MAGELKHLNDFCYFDNKALFDPKKLILFSEEDWIDFKTKKSKGIKLNAVIMEDNSKYSDFTFSNVGKPIVVKIAGLQAKPVNPGFIVLKNPEATIYSEYNNQLSVVADGFNFIEGEK